MKKTNRDIFNIVNNNKNIFSAMRRMDVAMQFRHHMAVHGIKNSDLAERLGVSEANVSKLLKGNQNFQLDTLYMLSDALEETLSVVVGDIHDLAQVADEEACEYQDAFSYASTKEAPDCSWVASNSDLEGGGTRSCDIYYFKNYLDSKKSLPEIKDVPLSEDVLDMSNCHLIFEEYAYAAVNS